MRGDAAPACPSRASAVHTVAGAGSSLPPHNARSSLAAAGSCGLVEELEAGEAACSVQPAGRYRSIMRAMVLDAPGAGRAGDRSHLVDLPIPEPGPGEIRVRVHLCGVCRTDLHVVEGDLPPQRARIVPGHQVVGVVDALGAGCTPLRARPARRHRLAARAPAASASTAGAATRTSARSARFTGCARGRRLRRVRRRARGLRLRAARRDRRRGGLAAALRRHHRLPRPAPRRDSPGRPASASTASAPRRTSRSRSRATSAAASSS